METTLGKIKVSIIVPVYNLEDYIEECLLSLISQETNFRYEIIAVDDCSTDKSWVILKRLKALHPQLLQIQRNKQNCGLATTMEVMLKVVRGVYIAYLDADDLALASKLQYQADYLDSHKDCSMVYHEMDVFDSETDKSLWLYVKDYYNRHHIPEHAGLEHIIRYGCFMHIGGVMVRNHDDILKTIDKNNKIILDHLWLALCAIHCEGSIDFINLKLGRYRIHNQSFGAQTRQSADRKKQVLLEQLHVCDLAEQSGLNSAIVLAGRRHYHYATALFFLKMNEDILFNVHIEKTTDEKWFLDEKHRKIWKNKKNPDEIRANYFCL